MLFADVSSVVVWAAIDCQCKYCNDIEMHPSGLGDSAPFWFAGSEELGVLCIHGFTGTPFEVRHLGRRLSERGFTVSGPALPGHTTSVAELDQTTWRDWYGRVEQSFDELRARCAQVAVVGQSLGGLLALYLAAQRGAELAAVAALATPLWLFPVARAAVWATRPGRPLTAGLGRLVSTLPKLDGSDVRDREMKRQNPCYRAVPVRALHQLVAFMGEVDRSLPEVRVPTLVMHSRQDHTAPFACSERIAAAVGAETVQHRALADSYHLLAVDVERDLVAEEVAGFVAAAAGAGAWVARAADGARRAP
jgi:carboxylesterase